MAYIVRKAIMGLKGQIVLTKKFDNLDEATRYALTCVTVLNAVWAEVWNGDKRVSLHVAS